jgi:CubicO group peptidase (beta-lactamase class C family)
MKTVTSLLLTCFCACAAAFAADSPKIAGVSEQMSRFINAGEISGAVTLVVSADRVLHLDAVGKADLESAAPMRTDSIFWIASMSKPVTAVAVLMLQDEGKLSIEDDAGKFLPELASLKLPDGRPAKVTIKHLMTHTAGLSESTEAESRSARTLAELTPAFGTRPILFAPGSRWQYSQSGINSLGRIVEVVSGLSFPEFLQKRLFGPLGMNDTTFYLTDEQIPRLARSYKLADGKLQPAAIFILGDKSPTSRDRYPAANGGLFSTAGDYARFCQMLINQGTLHGRHYLKPETVQLMAAVHSGDLKTGFTEGNAWGLGCCVVRNPQGPSAALSPGSYGHGGAFGTQAWIDPVKKTAYILMVQRANFPNADASDVRRIFQDTAAK